MEENKELVNGVEDVSDENFDDSEEYAKAKTFPIDESWPEEIKKQVQQLNAMSAMINEDPVIEKDSEDEVDADSDAEELDGEEQVVQTVSTEETETFGDVF